MEHRGAHPEARLQPFQPQLRLLCEPLPTARTRLAAANTGSRRVLPLPAVRRLLRTRSLRAVAVISRAFSLNTLTATLTLAISGPCHILVLSLRVTPGLVTPVAPVAPVATAGGKCSGQASSAQGGRRGARKKSRVDGKERHKAGQRGPLEAQELELHA